MIIYQDTKSGFLSDIAENHFQARIESAFFHKTGSVPSDSRGWASDYSRFADVLRPADELISRVGSMLEGNEEFTLIDEQDEAFRIIRHQVLDEGDRSERRVFVAPI